MPRTKTKNAFLCYKEGCDEHANHIILSEYQESVDDIINNAEIYCAKHGNAIYERHCRDTLKKGNGELVLLCKLELVRAFNDGHPAI